MKLRSYETHDYINYDNNKWLLPHDDIIVFFLGQEVVTRMSSTQNEGNLRFLVLGCTLPEEIAVERVFASFDGVPPDHGIKFNNHCFWN